MENQHAGYFPKILTAAVRITTFDKFLQNVSDPSIFCILQKQEVNVAVRRNLLIEHYA